LDEGFRREIASIDTAPQLVQLKANFFQFRYQTKSSSRISVLNY
jgi:hypothetical protein